MDSLRRVLFIRLSAIGDVVLVTPLIRLFHEHHPQVKIDVLVKEAYVPLLCHNPLIDQVLTLPQPSPFKAVWEVAKMIRARGYWLVFDMQKHWRSWFVTLLSAAEGIYRYEKYTWQRFLLVHFNQNRYPSVALPIPKRYFTAFRELDIPWRSLPLEIHIPVDIAATVEEKWPFAADDAIIALAPGASQATKRWPVARFVALIESLHKRFKPGMMLIGGAEDVELCRSIVNQTSTQLVDWSGATSLLETASALQKATVVVTHDTGVMHIAAAMRTKTVAIFGPTVEAFGFFPFEVTNKVIENSALACRPCSYHGTATCPKGHFKCMMDIEPDRVFQAVEAFMSAREITT